MPVVDIVLIVILVVALVTGVQRGLLASLGTLIGLVVGGFAALWVIPIVNDALPTPTWRGVVVVGGSLLLLLAGAGIGGAIGAVLRRGADRIKLGPVDKVLGGAASVVVAALAASLVGQSLAVTGTPGVSSAIGSSTLLRTIDALTPKPVQSTLAQLRSAVLDEGLPALGELLGPAVLLDPGPAPEIALDTPALDAAADSVARISGVASACGTSSTGSGFVIAADRVVTNAHVVAGVDRPVVQLPGGQAREGVVVYFDPVDDLAVIAVDELGAAALAVSDGLDAGADAVVQGYPYGGPFSMTPARIVSTGTTPVPDIYESQAQPREIYAVSADIVPGNSGGPLLTLEGEVAGVVFARSGDGRAIGYAMTPVELAPVLEVVDDPVAAVSAGACAA
ncbi:MarP family serine protease [Microbacterium hominis]|uniref:MarP family serine protease n=1 Tax=Microbacterium hominis TaxID=162426 RepID=A0A7D4PLW4_9MICO|nr:MarP family serine protease [Microbacterium hominis]QKJ19095.1 MarP family serine protease [Microbacterium hominis]